MMAVWLREFRRPEVLAVAETDAPVARPGEALIEVHFVKLAFIETQLRSADPALPAGRPTSSSMSSVRSRAPCSATGPGCPRS